MKKAKNLMKLAFYPYNFSNPNSYISRMKKAIEMAYPNITIIEVPSLKHVSKFNDIDIVWLNWYENLYSENLLLTIRETLIKIITITIFKLKKTRIITVLHNKEPHDMRFPYISKKLYKFILKNADEIIILCDDSKIVIENIIGKSYEGKIVKIPHPCYECLPKQNKSELNFSVAFFGLLRPYKGIESIIDLAKLNPDIRFSISGQPTSLEYMNHLISLASGCPNVIFKFKLLTEKEIDDIFENNSILLLPYDLTSSLNSGVVMYALSKGINVIVPSLGTIKELGKFNFTYNYKSNKDINNLLKIAKQDYTENIHDFFEKSNLMRKYVITQFSLKNISQIIKTMNF